MKNILIVLAFAIGLVACNETKLSSSGVDTVKVDSVKIDSAKKDTTKKDSVKVDSAKTVVKK